jgi:glutathione S-transferase
VFIYHRQNFMRALYMQPFPPSQGLASQAKAEIVLFELESMVSDGRRYLLGDTFSYADIVLASMLSLWALTGTSRKFFSGRPGNVLAESKVPAGLAQWYTSTHQSYPMIFDMVLRIYSQHRLHPSKRSLDA